MKKQEVNMQTIIDKLGFDPRNAEERRAYTKAYYQLDKMDGWTCDDSKPRILDRLTIDEILYLDENDLVAK